ncbi:MAG: putative rane protein [Anaerocolumna sp.]|jgi:O-antigen/teichoic acid export membrane protein|nr:putative rane protein [Anaerocolumna sp.]
MANQSEVNSYKQIKLGAVIAYVGIFVNIASGLIYTPWMIKSIGQENYGLYTLSVSLISLFVMDFGLNAALTRFITKYNSNEDQASVNNLLGIAYKLYVVLDLIIASALVIAYLFIGIMYKELTPSEIETLKGIYLITAGFSVLSFPFVTLSSILTSYEKFVFLKGSELFNRVLSLVLIIGALSMGYGIYTLVTINAITGLITIFIKLIAIKRITPVKVNFFYKSRKMLKEILAFSVWATVITISQRFIFNIMPSILGILAGSASIAIFGTAATIEGFVYTFASGINGMFLPKVSRLLSKEDSKTNLFDLMVKVGRIQFVIIGLLFVGFMSLGRNFIDLWIDASFKNAYYCAVLLVLPSLIELPQHIASITVVAVNKVKIQSFVYIAMAIINVILSSLLIKSMGEIGAALSICISYLFRTLAMNVIYKKSLNLDIKGFYIQCFVKLGGAFIFALICSTILSFVFPSGSWMLLFIQGITVTGIYMLSMWLFALNSYEKNLFLSLSKKIIRIGR